MTKGELSKKKKKFHAVLSEIRFIDMFSGEAAEDRIAQLENELVEIDQKIRDYGEKEK